MIKRLIEKLKTLRIYAVMCSADDIQELYCGNCDKDTKQKVYESGHERDSSHDRFECTECGFVKYGLTGEWEYYNQLPEHIKKDGIHWGFSDSVVQDSMCEWFEKNVL